MITQILQAKVRCEEMAPVIRISILHNSYFIIPITLDSHVCLLSVQDRLKRRRRFSFHAFQSEEIVHWSLKRMLPGVLHCISSPSISITPWCTQWVSKKVGDNCSFPFNDNYYQAYTLSILIVSYCSTSLWSIHHHHVHKAIEASFDLYSLIFISIGSAHRDWTFLSLNKSKSV